MNLAPFRRRIKPWMLPIAMVGGVFFHDFIERIAFLSPYLIFTMLLITFSRINISQLRFSRLSWWLLCLQIVGSIAVYVVFLPLGPTIAQATFICAFCPVATAAPVITGMLGGNISQLAAFSVLSNIAVAILAPILFSVITDQSQLSFIDSSLAICVKVLPLLLIPLLLATLLRRVTPKLHNAISSRQSISFYIWSVALFIVVGKAVTFVMKEPSEKIPEILLIAVCSGIVCCSQFFVGRKLGGLYGDKVMGGQGLGQKNTILAVWLALTYLNPIASIGPAAYVLWQNTINSWQLYRKARMNKI